MIEFKFPDLSKLDFSMPNACRKCGCIPDPDGTHTCPSPEYIAAHNRMISEACLAEEIYGCDALERGTVSLPTFEAMLNVLTDGKYCRHGNLAVSLETHLL